MEPTIYGGTSTSPHRYKLSYVNKVQWARLLWIANPNFAEFKIYITFDTDVPESSGFFCLADL